MTFRSWCYPLADYTRAFEDAGMLIEVLREPPHSGENERRRRIPNFLMGRARKPREPVPPKVALALDATSGIPGGAITSQY
jgi:hypothetical protein